MIEFEVLNTYGFNTICSFKVVFIFIFIDVCDKDFSLTKSQ